MTSILADPKVPGWEKLLGAVIGSVMLMTIALFLIGFPIGWYICSYRHAQMLSPTAALVLGAIAWIIVGSLAVLGARRGYRKGIRNGLL